MSGQSLSVESSAEMTEQESDALVLGGLMDLRERAERAHWHLSVMAKALQRQADDEEEMFRACSVLIRALQDKQHAAAVPSGGQGEK